MTIVDRNKSVGQIPVLLLLGAAQLAQAVPSNITFTQSAETIEAYDFVEVTLNVASPDAKNPFMDVTVEGQFGKAGRSQRLNVTDFCDSADGGVFRILPAGWIGLCC